MMLKKLIDPKLVEIITPEDHVQRGCQLSLFFHVDVDAAFELLGQKGRKALRSS
jgi:hypothetical protein